MAPASSRKAGGGCNVKHTPKLHHYIQDAMLILFAAIMILAFFCYAWACCDRVGWVRFVSGLPLPAVIKAVLWGWLP